MSQKTPYSEVKLCKSGATERYETGTPWKKSKVSFQLVNCPFPVLHKHEFYEIPIVAGDAIIHGINGKTHQMKHGEAWLIRPFDEHWLQKPSSTTPFQNFLIINFLIRAEYFHEFAELLEPGFAKHIDSAEGPLKFTLDGIDLSVLLNKCIQLLTLEKPSVRIKESQTSFLFFSLMSNFYNRTFSMSPSYPQWFTDFLTELHKLEFCSLPVNEICKKMSYSYSHFSRLFKTYTGVTLLQYITKIKINYAKGLLRNTKMTTLEISGILHYESLSHFNHTFKKETGQTPREYRKEAILSEN